MTITAATWTDTPRSKSADAVLKAAAKFWFAVAALGQWTFVYFIAGFYAGPTLRGNFESWNRKDLITGYVAGDHAGNLSFAAHVLLAALITMSGTLQLLPQIRARALSFHRWNGRFYVVAAFVMGFGGLWLVWVRGSYLTLFGAISISFMALLTMFAAAMTWRTVLARKMDAHHRWALRTFLLVNGVWFMRVGYMAWIIINQGPVGIGKRMDGPFDLIWGFGSFLLPLGVLELYLRTKKRADATGKFAMAATLVVLTLVMGIGIFGAYMFMWRPVL
jgi:hypothetical protein